MQMNCFKAVFGAGRRISKRLCVTVAAVCGIFAMWAAPVSTHLIIHFTDGSATSFVLTDKPSVSFVDNCVRVRAKHVDTDFEASKVAKFVFGDAVSSIEKIGDNEVRFTIPDCDHIYVSGVKGAETIRVVSVEGRLMTSVRADADGNAEIDLTEMPKGVYIVATESGKNIKMKH